MTVRFSVCPEHDDQPSKVEALTSAINEVVLRANHLFPSCAHIHRAVTRLREGPLPTENTGAVCDLLFHLSVANRQRLLETEPLSARLAGTLDSLHSRLAIAFVGTNMSDQDNTVH